MQSETPTLTDALLKWVDDNEGVVRKRTGNNDAWEYDFTNFDPPIELKDGDELVISREIEGETTKTVYVKVRRKD